MHAGHIERVLPIAQAKTDQRQQLFGPFGTEGAEGIGVVHDVIIVHKYLFKTCLFSPTAP